MLTIRKALDTDFEAIWPFFKAIVSSGDTYAFPVDLSRSEGKRLWMDIPRETYIAEDEGNTLGSYYIKTNQAGPGSHVCNCGYMVAEAARGKGIASQMCLHSLDTARALGYKAMQFNFVASTNEGAIRLWHKLGFETVGRLPSAFRHPQKGYVDALIMYQWLAGHNEEAVSG